MLNNSLNECHCILVAEQKNKNKEMATHFELNPPPGGNPSISSFINSCITRERFTSSGWLLSNISEIEKKTLVLLFTH